VDIVAAQGQIDSGRTTQCNVAAPSGVIVERVKADRSIIRAAPVSVERKRPKGRSIAAGFISRQRTVASGCVLRASRVTEECRGPIRRVVNAVRIGEERLGAASGVVMAAGAPVK